MSPDPTATYRYNYHGIFSLETNIRFFEAFYRGFKGNGPAEFRMRFFLDKGLRVSRSGKERVSLMLLHEPSSSTIEFDYPWLRPVCAKLAFEPDGSFNFLFNKNYLRLSYFAGGGWDLLSVFRSLLIVRLLQRGMYMVHGAAVQIGEDGVLIPAISNTGKSRASWLLAKQGARYLSDEYPVLRPDGTCYSFPCSSLLSPGLIKELGIRLTSRERLKVAANDVLGRLLTHRFAQSGIKLYPSRFLETADQARITKVFLIQDGVDGVQRINAAEALVRIRAIGDYETKWKTNPFVVAHSFFNRFDLASLVEKEDAFLRAFLSKVEDIAVVSSASAEHHRWIGTLLRGEGMMDAAPHALARAGA